jgi:ubiquinone/menaquinone biosynthesis C-methylase UbiE
MPDAEPDGCVSVGFARRNYGGRLLMMNEGHWGRRQFILAIGAALAAGGGSAAAQQTITPKAKELNKDFDADASQWIDRFEHEGRAIYDKRYEILDAMHLKPGMTVADIGAGSGLIARLMAQRVAPGTVYAVDISKNMIDHIEKTARDIQNLKAVLGDPHTPKLEPNSLDLVSIIDSYHHFEYPQDMLREINKAIRPEGVLVLIDFKRIDGVSKDYILKMVRAGEGTFTDEFQNAGFELIERRDEMFEDNYLLRFRHRRSAEKKLAQEEGK